MKSQRRQIPQEFDDKVIDTILSWNETFPGDSYFNKLHFVMAHLPVFVSFYHICGRASAESHESVHARMSRMKDAVSRMASTEKKYQTLFARITSNLKPGMAERDKKVTTKQTGKKRGQYNHKCTTKLQDEVETDCSVFADIL